MLYFWQGSLVVYSSSLPLSKACYENAYEKFSNAVHMTWLALAHAKALSRGRPTGQTRGSRAQVRPRVRCWGDRVSLGGLWALQTFL